MKVKNKFQKLTVLFMSLIVFTMAVSVLSSTTIQVKAATKTYKVTAKTKPLNNKYVKDSQYNSSTKQYYMLRSYLEDMEKRGGGTLVLKKGTYTIPNTLYVPSGSTIKLEKGVKLKATSTTGTLFQLVSPSKITKASKKYSGAKNITIQGSGATIDLGSSKATAVLGAHNNKVKIEGITFTTKKSDADTLKFYSSSNVTIKNCKFKGTGRTSTAIKLEIACSKKKPVKAWIKNDNTPNKNITITGCTFSKVDRGVATVRYADKKYDTKIKITNNAFKDIASEGIRGLNWRNLTITGNTFQNIGDGADIEGKSGIRQAIILSGAKGINITKNKFTNVPITIKFAYFKNTDAETKSFAAIKSTIKDSEMKKMLSDNTIVSAGEYRIRVYTKEGNDFESYYFEDDTDTYTITPTTETYHNAYIRNAGYNKYTKHFYVFRSYMEQVERNGGGTVIVKKGTYQITNEIPVPSNTTIILEDGVIFKKIGDTHTTSIKANKGIFALVDPSKMTDSTFKGYTKYNGVHDVVIKGPEKGTAILDSNYQEGVQAILMCFNKNVTIENITFKNMYEGHFIELDASQNVTIRNNIFMNAKVASTDLNKCFREAINLDVPDKATGGIWRQWIKKYDKTPNDNVTITENTFTNLNRAIGSHNFTPGSAHTNIKITNNIIEKTKNDSIRLINYKNLTISGNTFRNIAGGKDDPNYKRAIFLSGVNNATITNNTFKNVNRSIQINVYQYSDKKPYADIIKNNITEANKELMKSTNKLINVGEDFIRYSNNINESTQDRWAFEEE
ncbi:MAG: right-handed parallel beta-helix repeat-containing protein [Lachnospiraceae bacterium]|nr:right-handed parallel beta-helix repeat-containing protein [Lachnospiraceae bacterium]